jgi:hypothetical protein
MLGQVTAPAATVLLDDLLCRGEAMVANVLSVDQGNGAVGAAAQLCKLAGTGIDRA